MRTKIILLVCVTFMLAAVVGTFVLGLGGEINDAEESEEIKRSIGDFEVNFEQVCEKNFVRVTLKDREGSYPNTNEYINILKNSTNVERLNNDGSSVIVNISGRGVIEAIPSINYEGKKISSHKKSKKFEYYCN